MTIITNPNYPFKDIKKKDFSELVVGDIFFVAFPEHLYIKISNNVLNNSICLNNGDRFTASANCHLIKNPIIFQAGE